MRRLPTRLAAPDPGRRMRIVATTLLFAMAAIFIAAANLDEDPYGFWSFVKAFAEAAMVGGIADWFAVTALFRHPLGVPIPHTAIIPKNKDRIGDTLAAFLRDNFLTPSVVARRMRSVDLAGSAGRFLREPPKQSRLLRGGAAMLEKLLEALDPDRFGNMVKSALAERLRAFDAAPLLGRALDAAVAENRHVALLDEAIIWIARLFDQNQDIIRQKVHDHSWPVVRWVGLDAPIAERVIAAIDRLLTELVADPHHPLRDSIEERLRELAERLQHDPALQARVSEMKAALLANPALEHWWMGVWEQIRAGLLRAVRDPDAALAGQLGALLQQLGETLERDERLRAGINRFARRAMVGLAADYGDDIVRLVSETVRSWDATTITTRLEAAVGRDLQYIRINGTLVGGLVGLLIHTLEVLL